MQSCCASRVRGLMVVLGVLALIVSALFVFPNTQAEAATKNLVVDSSINSNGTLVVTMHSTESVVLNELRLQRIDGSAFSLTNTDLRQLLVSGQRVALNANNFRLTKASINNDTIVVSIPAKVSVGANQSIVLRWNAGFAPKNASVLIASAQVDDIPAEYAPVGNPTAAQNYKLINNYREPDKNKLAADYCSTNGGVVTARTWWGVYDDANYSINVARQGDTDVVQVQIGGVTTLNNRINIADPRLELHAGNLEKTTDPTKWRKLVVGQDFAVTVSGNSVYFHLNNSLKRDFSYYQFHVEAKIPLSGTASCTNTRLSLWNAGPAWFNRNAPALDLDAAETDRDEMDWLPKSAPNPVIPAQCGGNFALVFDLSGSVIDAKAQNSIATAGKNMVNALVGTGSSVSLFNFASAANTFPAATQSSLLSLSNPTDLSKLQTSVDSIANFGGGNQRRQDVKDDGTTISGDGTNWEAAFKAIPLNTYDTVIFVTDGVPTTSIRDYPNGYDKGQLINQSDLSRGVEAANQLKNNGTRIETIMVGVPSYNEFIPKDDYFYLSNIPWATLDAAQKAEIKNNNGYGYPTLYGNNLSTSVPALLEDGGGFSIWLGDPVNNPEYNVTNQPDLWLAGIRSSEHMAEDVSGPGAVHNLENYGQLSQELRDLVLHGCDSAVTVEKKVKDFVDGDGTEKPGEGWTFTASDVKAAGTGTATLEGANAQGTVSAQTQLATSNAATVSFPITFNTPNQSASVTINETQQDGWTLVKQGTGNNLRNAQCYDQNNGNTPVTVVDQGAAGFTVSGVSEDTRIHCVVINERRPSEAHVQIQKVDANNVFSDLTSEAEFSIHTLTQNGDPDPDTRITASAAGSGSPQFTVKPGVRYALVEEQAPGGYSLLPSPIYFEIGTDPGQSAQKIYLLSKKTPASGAPATFTRMAGWSDALVTLVDGQAQNPPATQQGAYPAPDGTFTVRIADVHTGTLPRSGGAGVAPLALGGLAVAGLAVLAARRSRKN